MKFVQRLGYYLGGVSIGVIILLFFLNGKEASCDYGPNARTVKNITGKPFIYSQPVMDILIERSIDTSSIRELIKYGDVDFSESDTKSQPCKTYQIENTYKQQLVALEVKNCDSMVEILEFRLKNRK